MRHSHSNLVPSAADIDQRISGQIAGVSATGRPLSLAEPLFGYRHPRYAESLAEFGAVLELPQSEGQLLRRRIPDTDLLDATHCYPLFACRHWERLKSDLDSLAEQIVSVVAVTDPFAPCSLELLREAFPDVGRVYKQHFVTDLRLSDRDFVSPHHARNARISLSHLRVVVPPNSGEMLDAWLLLYEQLIVRHDIRGVARFSPAAFRMQFEVPGCVVLAAQDDQGLVGMQLWYQDREVAYYHLAAYSERGYKLRASFGLFSFALSEFRARGVRYLALGAGAGKHESSDGLTRFKRGWSSGTRPAFLCGRICNQNEYSRLTERTHSGSSLFFPQYRSGNP
jgi:hypothetical protein